jgi:hypothetical protein
MAYLGFYNYDCSSPKVYLHSLNSKSCPILCPFDFFSCSHYSCFSLSSSLSMSSL